MTMRNRLLLIAAVALLALVATAQSTLGNMFKLGVVTTSTRPASSAAIEGALIYDGDAGAPIYNNGTAWKQLVDSSSLSNSWYDGGVTYVAPTDPNWPNRTGVIGPQTSIFSDAPIQNADAGALWIGGRNSVGQLATALNIFTDTNGQPTIAFRGTSQSIWGQIFGSGIVNAHTRFGLNLRAGTIGLVNGTTGDTNADTVFGAFDSSTGGYIAEGGAGTYAWSMTNVGARVKFSPFNASSIDYLTGDGTGITTPTYVSSSYAFATGVGLVAPRIKPTGTTDDNFVAAATGAGSLGSLAFNQSTSTMYVQKTSGSFAPIAQSHPVFDKQTFTMLVQQGHTDTAAAHGGPQFAEVIKTGTQSADTFMMNWDYGASGIGVSAFSTTLLRTGHLIQTSAADVARVFAHSSVSSSPTTLTGIVAAGAQPQWCQSIATGAVITAMRLQAGLVSAVTPSASTDIGAPGVIFRYDTSVDGFWYLCTRDATTQNCASTGVTVAGVTNYTLCLRLDSTRTVFGSINGVYIGKIGSNVIPNNTTLLSPWLSLQLSGTSTANGVFAGPMQVESL